MPLLFQRVRYILGHVGLVVFGKHGIGAKYAGRIERALGHHALPFAEKVRQKARIRHRQFGAAIGDLEGNGEVVATLERTWLHQTAEPEPPARQDMLLSDHGGRREEHDGIAHGVEHQSCRERQYRKRAADDRQSPLLTRHGVYPSSPRFFRPSLSRRNRSASLSTALRASASALFALSRSPITIYARTRRSHPSTSSPFCFNRVARRSTMPRIIALRSPSLISFAAPIVLSGSAGAAVASRRANAACTSGRHGASAGAFASIARQIEPASAVRPSWSAASPG